jgi:hypothetical protein
MSFDQWMHLLEFVWVAAILGVVIWVNKRIKSK